MSIRSSSLGIVPGLHATSRPNPTITKLQIVCPAPDICPKLVGRIRYETVTSTYFPPSKWEKYGESETSPSRIKTNHLLRGSPRILPGFNFVIVAPLFLSWWRTVVEIVRLYVVIITMGYIGVWLMLSTSWWKKIASHSTPFFCDELDVRVRQRVSDKREKDPHYLSRSWLAWTMQYADKAIY